MNIKSLFSSNASIAIAILLALLSGYLGIPLINSTASAIADIFINLLKLLSAPIIFLSLVATISGMENIEEFKNMGKRTVKYTILTTLIASFLALLIFLFIDPVNSSLASATVNPPAIVEKKGYLSYLIHIVPSNFIYPFLHNQVISVLFLAILFSLAILALPQQQRTVLSGFFSSLYAAVMKMTSWVVLLMPLAIWSFITLFVRDMREGLEIKRLALYLACVLLANLIQGLVILPVLIKSKGVSPIKLFKGMLPALSLAFFSKSSSATLPLAMQCAEERVGIPRKTVSFSMPLCVTMNMNACAAFILTTVLFVSMSHGMTYSPLELGVWVVIATLAALGNAGVPMGCYFLSSALLASLNVPLNIMGIILPFYALIDMLETAINVWSDSCVVSIVNKELENEDCIKVEA